MPGFVRDDGRDRSQQTARLNLAVRVDSVEALGGRHYAMGEDITTGAPVRVCLSSRRGQGPGIGELEVKEGAGSVIIALGCEPSRIGTLEARRLMRLGEHQSIITGDLIRVSRPFERNSTWTQLVTRLEVERSTQVQSYQDFEAIAEFLIEESDQPYGGIAVRGYCAEADDAVAFTVPLFTRIGDDGFASRAERSIAAFASRERIWLRSGESEFLSGGETLDLLEQSFERCDGYIWEVVPYQQLRFATWRAEEAAYGEAWKDPSSAFVTPEGHPGFLPAIVVIGTSPGGNVTPRMALPCRDGMARQATALERISTTDFEVPAKSLAQTPAGHVAR